LSRCLADPVFVFNGDTFLDLEAQELFARWHEQKKPVIVARTIEDTSRYGSLIVSDSRVIGFNEKGTPGKGLINAGCYLFNRDILNRYPLFEAFSLERDFLSSAVHSMEFHYFETSGLFIDIGVPEDYEMAQTLLAGV